ncbi:nuclear transport factor 2 family protein [Sabulicella rubraurantiaca]|uniref:hypothetical protein n=1 Tax=Sabulicella rubraurantiaca TaxID=2811429 RepID=UPI001A96C402|nr:hypothetical protein [Sabulicella rubraurantiaca]
MRQIAFTAVLLSGLGTTPALAVLPEEEARRLYAEFVSAQNAHDLERVRGLFAAGPGFLWVTNGLPIWGRDAAVARLARFHANEVWRIEAAEERARAVAVAPGASFLHIPLTLIIGTAAEPRRYHILVAALCAETPEGWRIAALFTTDENREEAPR